MKSATLLLPFVLAGSGSAVAAGAAGAFQPGQWEITTRMLAMEMPGMPAGLVKSMIGKPMTIRHCLSAADAASDPQALLRKSGANCSYGNFRMSGGTVDATMSCKQGGNVMTGRTSGRYTPTSYDMTSQMSTSSGMKSTSTATGKWIGPCR